MQSWSERGGAAGRDLEFIKNTLNCLYAKLHHERSTVYIVTWKKVLFCLLGQLNLWPLDLCLLLFTHIHTHAYIQTHTCYQLIQGSYTGFYLAFFILTIL